MLVLAAAVEVTRADTARELWASYDREGDKPGPASEPKLAAHRQAAEIAEREVKARPNDVEWQEAVAISYNKIGRILRDLAAKPEDALIAYQRAMEAASLLAELEPRRADRQLLLTGTLLDIGSVYDRLGRSEDSLRTAREALSINQRVAAALPDEPSVQRALMSSYFSLGSTLASQRDFAGAEGAYRSARNLAERLAGGNDFSGREALASANDNLGASLANQGKFDESLKYYQEALAIWEQLNRERPDAFGTALELARGHSAIGRVLLRQGRYEQSLSEFQASIAVTEALMIAQPGNPFWVVEAGTHYGSIGYLHAMQGHVVEARENLQKGRDMLARVGADTTWFDEQLAKLK